MILILGTGLLTGCAADYLNHYDSVTLAAGDTQKFNSMLQTVDPLNPASRNTHIEGDGARAAAVAQGYKYPPPPPPPAPITVNVGGSANTVN
ncbi:hypothetical protein [Mesorhizobium sp. Root695]|uniref:hypothetical protein n=1 Tax=Mesorhizobium sp. Root695 TaxID=1736589 RepID=UPI001FCDBA27|nr:hypothetical protein [Mesorhizobium sp. Root695]